MERRSVYVLLMVALLALGLPAWAEEKPSAPAKESVKETPAPKKSEDKKKSSGKSESHAAYAKCDEGVKKCEPLKKDKGKYARCMKLSCTPKQEKAEALPEDIPGIGPKEKTEDEKKQERICEIGLRKCNSLRELGDRYWLCMDETCNSKEDLAKDPACAKGKKECAKPLEAYRRCVQTTCPSTQPDCAEGVQACGLPLAGYWDCVSGICLGSVEKYKDPDILKPKEEKRAMVPDRDGKMRKLYTIGEPHMPLLGVPEQFAYAPPGITEENWRSRAVPREVLVTNDILQRVECRNRSLTITCTGSHMGTCMCSDGSRPVPKQEIKERGYMAVFNDGEVPQKPRRR